MITQDRQYRTFEIRAIDSLEDMIQTPEDSEMEPEETYLVEGYAAVFDQPTVMYEMDGIKYKEVIDRNAFSGAVMDDVVMNFDHEGRPFARTKNGSLTLTVDDIGLKVNGDLKMSDRAKEIYKEIKAGLIDKMSFAFTVAEESYDKGTRTRRILRIKRLYDVSCVSIPAYDTTSISARSFFKAEAERELAEARELEQRKRKLKLLIELEV